jgi:multidrug transporter EmrE-like cation transporter
MLWRALEVMHPLFAAGLFCTLLGVLISRLRPKMSPESQGRLGCVLGCLFLVLSVLLYIFVGVCLVQTFKLTGLAFTNALWSGLSVMATTSVGVLYFKEVLHLHDFIAIAMIGSGVMILKFTD